MIFLQENCSETIYASDAPFQRLEHYKLHEYTKKWNQLPSNNNLKSPADILSAAAGSGAASKMSPSGLSSVTGKETVNMTLSTNLDSMFKRKRGRPPKNRVVEVSH